MAGIREGQIDNIVQTLTDQATIDWDTSLGHVAKVTLTASRIMGAPTNLREGQTYNLKIIQGGAGSFLITWNAIFKWPEDGTAPILSLAAGLYDRMTFIYQDGVLDSSSLPDFA